MVTAATIKQKVLSILELEDDEEALQKIAEWLDLGMEDCYQRLRPWWMRRSSKITIEAKEIDDEDCSRTLVPPSYLAMIAVHAWLGGNNLNSVSADQLGAHLASGKSGYFVDGPYITFLPLTNLEQIYRATYWTRFDKLTDDSQENLLTERGWNAIVYASLRHAAIWQKDLNAVSAYDTAFNSMVDVINKDAYKAQAGSGYTITRERR